MRKFLIAVLFAAAVVSPALAQKETVRVGVTDRPDNAALMIALKRGYFERRGIEIDLVGGGNAAQDFVASLSLGQIDVTAGSPSAGLFNALNRGIDIRIVGDWARVGSAGDATFALVARKELLDSGEVKSAADLKGKPVGIGPVHGGVNDMMIDAAMRKVGLTTDDIS